MYRLISHRFLQGSGGVNLSARRTAKALIRTPRRILNSKQAAAFGKEVEEVKYDSSDLMADQASRAAIQNANAAVATGRTTAVGNDLSLKKKRVLRLDKLDKTTNINFVQLMSRLRTKSYRDKTKQILLEGKRLITDALLAGCKLRTLVYTDKKLIEHLPVIENEAERIFIDKARMATWSLMEAPPGIMAVVERPTYSMVANDDRGGNRIPLTVVVDGVREPSNMGAIIRTLGAAGCECILITRGSCDPWEEKVLRSGMGAHFRVPIFTNIDWSRLINFVPDHFRMFLADSNSFEVVKEAASYLQDANGDSLSLITGEDSSDDEADKFGTGVDEVQIARHGEGPALIDEAQLREPDSSALKQHTLPIFQYHEPSYFGAEGEDSHCLLVVGGETSSLSAAAYQFAHLHSGSKVHISMSNGINSLNAGTAMGVIAFEIQRQFRQRRPLKRAELEDGSKEGIEENQISGLLISESNGKVSAT